MLLASYLHLIFGIAFVMRTLHVFRARAVISERCVTKTGTGALALLLAQAHFTSHTPWRGCFLTALIVISTLVLCLALERRTLCEWRERMPSFLDRWILNLRLGNSVAGARDAALLEESEQFQALLRPLFNSSPGERGGNPIAPPNLARELEAICATRHSSLARLEALRRGIRAASDFRHKSGLAVRQTAIQAVVMLVLLLALAVFAVRRHGWIKSGDLVTVAFLLSGTGAWTMLKLAGKSKWKI